MNINNIFINSVFSKVFLIVLSFINSILINRYLGPELRGEYAIILNLTNIIAVILGFNITSSYPYFLRKYKENISEKIINTVIIQMFIYLFIIFIIYIIGSRSSIIDLLLISIIVQFSNQLDFITIIKNINKRNKLINISGLFQTILLFILYLFTSENIKYVIAVLICFHLTRILLYCWSNKIKFSLNSNSDLRVKEIIKFSFFPTVTSLLTILNYNMDVIILDFFVGKKDIGLYSLAVTLASMLWIIPDAFKDVFFNKTAKNDSILSLVLSIKINIYISLIVIILFTFIGNEFINLVYGSDFGGSFYVCLILISGTIPMIFFKLISTLYQAIGKQHYSFWILALSVLINFVINILLIPLYGIYGAAISSVFSYLICGLIMMYTFQKIYKIKSKKFFVININDYKSLLKKLN